MTRKKNTFTGQVTDIDLRLLRIFKMVVDCGGFSAAEASLNISGAAISIAMSDLETRLGCRLCQRGRSGFAVTQEGKKVYESTKKVLLALDEFRSEINAIHSHLEGELNVGMTDNLVTLPHMCISNTISNLKAREPNVRIHLRMMPPDDIEVDVLEGQLQVGVVPSMRPLPGCDYYPLYQEEFLLYCGSNHPFFNQEFDSLAPEDVERLDAVSPAYTEKTDSSNSYEKLNASATASDREGIAVLILSGSYIGYLPTHFADQWVKAGRMKPLLPNHFSFATKYSAIVRKSSYPSRLLQAFIEELHEVLKNREDAK